MGGVSGLWSVRKSQPSRERAIRAAIVCLQCSWRVSKSAQVQSSGSSVTLYFSVEESEKTSQWSACLITRPRSANSIALASRVFIKYSLIRQYDADATPNLSGILL